MVQTTREDRSIYDVVVVCCLDMGPTYAVETTSALLSRWKPRHVFLVGVALGLNGETKHGDIIIANQVADYHLGKKETGKKREIRWRGFMPGASIFDSARAMDSAWRSAIKAARPGPGESQVISGTVASGGDVVADDELIAEFLAHWPKLVGIEMEAGGTATAVHGFATKPDFLMIKSVSDHGQDKHDPDVVPWRAYAYAAAAAFAVELMRSGPTRSVQQPL
jgi:nucleoside phosphorylase